MNSDQKDIIFPRDKGGGSKLSTFLMQGIMVSHFLAVKQFSKQNSNSIHVSDINKVSNKVYYSDANTLSSKPPRPNLGI